MARRKMKRPGICPHCNKQMKLENGDNGETTEYWWECECGRNYNEDGKDITDYEFTDIL